MIPQEKSAAVTQALRQAFGVTEFEDISQITKGHNWALVFRIVVRGSPYLLRVISDRQLQIVAPTREFTCMKAAAESGLAPHVWYTSVEDGIAITDFIEEVPFPTSEALVSMPAVLRSLHTLTPFPKGVNDRDTTCMFLLHKGPAQDGLFQRFRAANALSKSDTDKLFAWHAQVAAVYPHHDPGDMVPSHNDLFKPDNTLFDGKRVWLVDWEAAFQNDRYADLAVVANLLVTNDAEENAFLLEYFGQPPDEYQRARFFLMRQLSHMFYAMLYLMLGSGGKPLDQTFDTFNRRLWKGELGLADKDAKATYGKVHWEQLVQNEQQARFAEALTIVKDRYTSSPRSST